MSDGTPTFRDCNDMLDYMRSTCTQDTKFQIETFNAMPASKRMELLFLMLCAEAAYRREREKPTNRYIPDWSRKPPTVQ